jgi:O-antigen ligase
MPDTARQADDGSSGSFFDVVALLFLAIALAAGGSSGSPMSAGIVQIAALPPLALALWRLQSRRLPEGAAWPLGILTASALLVLLQLIPMPPELWSRLPGRATVVEAYAAAGVVPPWLPVSLTPQATWRAMLGFAPPAAMLLIVLLSDPPLRRALVLVCLAGALVSVGLGLAQMAGGPASPLRFYAFTNPDEAVGLFANRNHQATFLAASLPLGAWFAARSALRSGPRRWFWALAGAAFALAVAAGVAATTSRAGVAMTGLGLMGGVAAALCVLRAGDRGGARWLPAAVFAAAVVTCAGVATLGFTPLAGRLTAGFQGELRLQLAPAVAHAGLAFAPVGSGAGSFDEVYPMFERPKSLTAALINHAHNEYLEIWLECGFAGVALMAAFVWWWAASAVRMLRPTTRSDGLDLAGVAIVGVVMAHSLVDYPLRAPGMAVVFALACGLMVTGFRRTPA